MGESEKYLTGAYIWESIDGITWQQVTGNGFGDKYILNFQASVNFGKRLYVSGSKGAISSASGVGGAKILRQVYSGPDP